MTSIPPPKDICHYCHKTGPTKRCSRCKAVYYCSTTCQKKDWKLSHRRDCFSSTTTSTTTNNNNNSRGSGEDNATTTTASTVDETTFQNAAEELSHLLGGLSLDQMVEQFHRASDEIRRLEGEEGEGGETKEKKRIEKKKKTCKVVKTEKQTRVNAARGEDLHVKRDKVIGCNSRTTELGEEHVRLEPTRTVMMDSSSFSTSGNHGRLSSTKQQGEDIVIQSHYSPAQYVQDLFSHYKVDTSSSWECIVEKLPYISTLIVTLVPCGVTSDNCNHQETRDEDDKIDPNPLLLQHLKIAMFPESNSHSKQNAIASTTSSVDPRRQIHATTVLVLYNPVSCTILQQLTLPYHVVSTVEQVQSSQLTCQEDNVLSMRLVYHDPHQSYLDNIGFESTGLVDLIPLEALNHLQCRSCHQRLLVKKSDNGDGSDDGGGGGGGIMMQGVFPLPVGYWDEITDYLTCYEGQPSIDFSSSSNNMVRRGIALEDDSLLVVNRDDLDKNVCILALEGYGETTMIPPTATTITTSNEPTPSLAIQVPQQSSRQDIMAHGGNDDWRDVVGGATLTCSQCCWILGYASLPNPDSSCRLYKHRLEAIMTRDDDDGGGCKLVQDWFKDNTIGSFLGKELIRYAESKAVFTFWVFDQDGSQEEDDKTQCLFIRVLSWNTMVARKKHPNDDDPLDFRPCVKVIYQHKRNVSISQHNNNKANNNNNNKTNTNVSKFMGDACCPPSFVLPFANAATPGADATMDSTTSPPLPTISKQYNQISTRSVNLYLDSQEWKELHDLLKDASNFFSDSVSRATVKLKLGVQEEGDQEQNENTTKSLLPSSSRAKLSFLSL